MTGDWETELTLSWLRDAREDAEAEQADAEYEAAFGDEDGDDEEPFFAQYQSDGYEPRRLALVVLVAAVRELGEERQARKLLRIPGLFVRA